MPANCSLLLLMHSTLRAFIPLLVLRLNGLNISAVWRLISLRLRPLLVVTRLPSLAVK